MKIYDLYVESGPKQKKTLVHVPELCGCICSGATTLEAINQTPDAIRVFLRFLSAHGLDAPGGITQDDPYTVRVKEHITEGYFIGNGSPAIIFSIDWLPIALEETSDLTSRLLWMRDDLLRLVDGLPLTKLYEQPGPRSGSKATPRPIRTILEHIIATEYINIQSYLGDFGAAWKVVTLVQKHNLDIVEGLRQTAELAAERLDRLTEDELHQTVQRGQQTWTARKMFRHTLEHTWDHLLEIRERLGR